MLKELQVKNFAIIDDVRIEFGGGLNVLSGETGAGKTLIIEAINLLTGERADSGLIRDGRDKLLVQGFFDFSHNESARDFLVDNNILDEEDFDNDVVISRELNRKGKNKAFINGLFTQVGILKGLGDRFLDLHGQHHHQYLLDPGSHMDIVDNSAKDAVMPAKKDYVSRHEKYASLRERLAGLKDMQSNRDARLQDLKFRYNEIEKLDIRAGEQEKLEGELGILKNFESIYRAASETLELINSGDTGEAGLSGDIALIQENMERLASFDNRFTEFSQSMNSLSGLLEEIGRFITDYLSDIDFSRERLDSIQERLYSFSLIKKKYNIDIDRAGEYLDRIREEIGNYESLESDIKKCREELEQALEDLEQTARILSQERTRAASLLEDRIVDEMEDLGFRSIEFKIRNQSRSGPAAAGDEDRFTKNGIDDMQFYISLNTGESPRPLKRSASGGELSRVMLAIKSALGAADNISTMVFDEIDSGVGGRTSFIVGEKLYKISLKKQIIVISHLAQIASFSDSHYFIDKYVEEGRTKIKIKKLGKQGKLKEISRMLGGEKQSHISLSHAGELIEKAEGIKKDLDREALKIGH